MKNLFVLGLTLVCLGAVFASATTQCNSVDKDSPDAVKQEVTQLFNKTLDSMEYILPSGIKATTWKPPEKAVEDEIHCFGDAAIPAITALLGSNRPFGDFLSVRMLAWVGGPQIIQPIEEVLSSSSSSQIVKHEAVWALITVPPDQALPVVEEVLNSETDSDLLETANRVKAALKEKER